MAEQKNVTVYHPTHEGVTYEVPATDAGDWHDSGWLKSAPSKPTVTVTSPAE